MARRGSSGFASTSPAPSARSRSSAAGWPLRGVALSSRRRSISTPRANIPRRRPGQPVRWSRRQPRSACRRRRASRRSLPLAHRRGSSPCRNRRGASGTRRRRSRRAGLRRGAGARRSREWRAAGAASGAAGKLQRRRDPLADRGIASQRSSRPRGGAGVRRKPPLHRLSRLWPPSRRAFRGGAARGREDQPPGCAPRARIFRRMPSRASATRL